MDLILNIKDFTSQKAPGYKIAALIDSYSNLIDITPSHILRKIQEYALKRGNRPLSLVNVAIEGRTLTDILKKIILSLNEEMYWDKSSNQIDQVNIQGFDLKTIYKELTQVNVNTKTIKDIQSVFLVFFILEFIVSFLIGFGAGAGWI